MSNKTIWVTWKQGEREFGQQLDMRYCSEDDINDIKQSADAGTFRIHESAAAMAEALSKTGIDPEG